MVRSHPLGASRMTLIYIKVPDVPGKMELSCWLQQGAGSGRDVSRVFRVVFSGVGVKPELGSHRYFERLCSDLPQASAL